MQYRKQLTMASKKIRESCDLLEKSYFCSIANNVGRVFNITSFVVICLKNRTFAVSQTTQMCMSSTKMQVVICLKNRTFAVSQTTFSSISFRSALL